MALMRGSSTVWVLEPHRSGFYSHGRPSLAICPSACAFLLRLRFIIHSVGVMRVPAGHCENSGTCLVIGGVLGMRRGLTDVGTAVNGSYHGPF